MKTPRLLTCLALAGVALAFATGCSTQKAWVYKPNTYASAPVNTQKKVVVLPYEDARDSRNKNNWMLYMVPLMPFGWQDLNVPEGSTMHMTSALWVNYKPTEDFGKALAEDLRKTGLFNDAFFDYRRENSDYFVKGRILNTRYQGKVISYCLSVYGPLLWVFGLPAASTSNELGLELNLMDSKSDQILFTKTYTAEPRKTLSWLYVMKDDFNYAEMLAEVNKQFCTDILPVVSTQAHASQ